MSVDLRGIRRLVDAEIADHWDGVPIPSEVISVVLVILHNNHLLRDDVRIGDVQEWRARVRRVRVEGLGYVTQGETRHE